MKTLYLELNMGTSGDMLMGALYDLIDEKDKFLQVFNSIEGVELFAEKVERAGIVGTKMRVLVHGVEEEVHDHKHKHGHDNNHNHNHDYGHDQDHEETHGHHDHHRKLKDIEAIINALDIPPKVKEDGINIYKLIAEAEAVSHDMPVEEVHFHEVGSMDAVVDVVGVALLMDMIRPDKILASPIHIGRGRVRCAHGILPVPAPATAYLIKDMPVYQSQVEGELLTPTGAALLKYFVEEYREMPMMKIMQIGLGAGSKDFKEANLTRAFLGTIENEGQIIKLETNIDDQTGEELSYTMEVLFEQGAREVFFTPVTMKKSRPGVLLTVIADEENRGKMVDAIFKHTTTIGIREYKLGRHTMDREIKTRKTSFGDIRVKVSKGFAMEKEKFEFEDLKRIAIERELSIGQVKEEIEKD